MLFGTFWWKLLVISVDNKHSSLPLYIHSIRNPLKAFYSTPPSDLVSPDLEGRVGLVSIPPFDVGVSWEMRDSVETER